MLGADEHGTWLWGAAGRTIWRGETPVFQTQQPALALIVPDAWWSPTWWVGHPEVEVYVNIGTPHVWEETRVTSIDLDLDVIRFCDGRVEVVDRDEFALHQAQFGYPADVIDKAETATALVLDHLTRRTPPFDEATARRWIEHAQSAAPGEGAPDPDPSSATPA